jgi:hypothetical protein
MVLPFTPTLSEKGGIMAVSQHKKGQLPRRGFKLREAFEILGIGETVGRQLIKDKKLKTIRLGPRFQLISQEEIDRFLREGPSN